jgi:DNA-binding FrmR family transcriptional regulator
MSPSWSRRVALPVASTSGIPYSRAITAAWAIQRLVEDDTYCIDILTQIASVNAALQKVALGLVDQHLRHCVMEAVNASPEAGEERLAEAILAVERLAQL